MPQDAEKAPFELNEEMNLTGKASNLLCKNEISCFSMKSGWLLYPHNYLQLFKFAVYWQNFFECIFFNSYPI